MKLYSYVVATDNGAAPNPFWGHCTLAICKPNIRRGAEVGDWVVGIGSAAGPHRGRMIYAMKVEEYLPIEEYFEDPRFQIKKPDPASPDWRQRRGDNQYQLQENGNWNQLPGPHVLRHMEKDLGGEFVLISKTFFYFGNKAVAIPEQFYEIAEGGRGHRCNFSDGVAEEFVTWIVGTYSIGVHGEPEDRMFLGSTKSCSGDVEPMETPIAKVSKEDKGIGGC